MLDISQNLNKAIVLEKSACENNTYDRTMYRAINNFESAIEFAINKEDVV
jgi:hypothetical protein